MFAAVTWLRFPLRPGIAPWKQLTSTKESIKTARNKRATVFELILGSSFSCRLNFAQDEGPGRVDMHVESSANVFHLYLQEFHLNCFFFTLKLPQSIIVRNHRSKKLILNCHKINSREDNETEAMNYQLGSTKPHGL